VTRVSPFPGQNDVCVVSVTYTEDRAGNINQACGGDQGQVSGTFTL